MLLEYLGRGTFHQALCRVLSQNATFPNRVLWHIFECCKSPLHQLTWIPVNHN